MGQHQMLPQQAGFFGAEAARKDAVDATSTLRRGEGQACCPLCLGLTNDVSNPKGTYLGRARGSGCGGKRQVAGRYRAGERPAVRAN